MDGVAHLGLSSLSDDLVRAKREEPISQGMSVAAPARCVGARLDSIGPRFLCKLRAGNAVTTKDTNEAFSPMTIPVVDPCAKAPCGLSAEFLSTGDLARACETTLRTVRFYEETGLVEPSTRSEGGHRMYDPAQREKLQLIMDLREAGLSIQDIKDLFALKSKCGSATEASERMTKTLESRVNELQRKIVVLRRLRDELASMVSVVRECGSCEHKEKFSSECNACDVMERGDLPRAMRLLWGK